MVMLGPISKPYLLLLGFCVLIIMSSATLHAAAEVREVSVYAEVYGTGKTPGEARHEALQRAREAAVAKVAGVNVSAQQLRLKSERQGEILDAFSTVILTATQGRILKEMVAYQVRLEGDLPVYRADLIATVAFERGERDPEFTLSLRTIPDTQTFRDGEKITLQLEASQDCHVLVLNVLSDGNVVQLIPSPSIPHNLLSGNEAKRFPENEELIQFQVGLLDGRRRDQEMILAIATRENIPFRMDSESNPDDDLQVGTHQATLVSLNSWLVGIPLDSRVEASWIYEIVE
jgi:hypothetical protein